MEIFLVICFVSQVVKWQVLLYNHSQCTKSIEQLMLIQTSVQFFLPTLPMQWGMCYPIPLEANNYVFHLIHNHWKAKKMGPSWWNILAKVITHMPPTTQISVPQTAHRKWNNLQRFHVCATYIGNGWNDTLHLKLTKLLK